MHLKIKNIKYGLNIKVENNGKYNIKIKSHFSFLKFYIKHISFWNISSDD